MSDRYTHSDLSKLAGWDAGITSRDMNNMVIGVGYSYRSDSSKSTYFNYDVGLGDSEMSYDSSTSSDKQTKDLGFTLLQSLNFNYRLVRLRNGKGRGDYAVGLGLSHSYIFNDKVDGVSIGGGSLGALAFFKLGF